MMTRPYGRPFSSTARRAASSAYAYKPSHDVRMSAQCAMNTRTTVKIAVVPARVSETDGALFDSGALCAALTDQIKREYPYMRRVPWTLGPWAN